MPYTRVVYAATQLGYNSSVLCATVVLATTIEGSAARHGPCTLQEIDAPREWYFNTSSRTLYYMPNASDDGLDSTTGLPTGEFAATGAKVLINVTGNQARPVANISITGLIIRDTSYTYMDEHGLPSGGE